MVPVELGERGEHVAAGSYFGYHVVGDRGVFADK